MDVQRSAQASADDARVLAALRAGDEKAFLALVQSLNAPMLRVASVYVSSRAVAEEVVQEAWLGGPQGTVRVRGPLLAAALDLRHRHELRQIARSARGAQHALLGDGVRGGRRAGGRPGPLPAAGSSALAGALVRASHAVGRGPDPEQGI